MRATVLINLYVEDAGRTRLNVPWEIAWNPADLFQETVALAIGYNVLNRPTGARLLVIDPGDAVSLTLKEDVGDVGLVFAPASNPLKGPLVLFLSPTGTPEIGITSSSVQDVTLYWLT
jgi:hypothetical protein